MNEQQAEQFLINIFGPEGAVNLTELEARAIGVLLNTVGLPFGLTEEEKGKAAYQLHTLNRFTDMVTARAAIDSVVHKAAAHREQQIKYKEANDTLASDVHIEH